MDYEIIHQPEQKLFKTEVDGRTAFVQYRLIGDSLDIIHTIVPQPIEGRGIAAALVNGISYSNQGVFTCRSSPFSVCPDAPSTI